MSQVMTLIGLGWSITWLAYASDYSRFVPRSVPRNRLFWAGPLGQFVSDPRKRLPPGDRRAVSGRRHRGIGDSQIDGGKVAYEPVGRLVRPFD